MTYALKAGLKSRPPLFLLLSSLAFGTALVACGDSEPSPACGPGSFGAGGDDCTPCDAGSYCPQGITVPIDCAEGELWDHDADPKTACAKPTTCGWSEWQAEPPTATSNRVCVPLSECTPGQYVKAQPTLDSDRVCSGCPSGSLSYDNNAESCTPWTPCQAGTYVSRPGSASKNQLCSPCEADSYTSGPNQAACVPDNSCAPGTVQTTPGSTTSPVACAACSEGSHCAGGDAPSVACTEFMWDHDADPATACIARTACIPGQYVLSEGDALIDRVCGECSAGTFSEGNAASCTEWKSCAPGTFVSQQPAASRDRGCSGCAAGHFSGGENAASCAPFKVCEPGTVEWTRGSSTHDRACTAGWARQFGTAQADHGLAVTVDAEDNVLVGGRSTPEDGGQPDAFVRKFDSEGNLLWSQLFRFGSDDAASALSVDAEQNVLVVGNSRNSGNLDGFVRKLDRDGHELWAHLIGGPMSDYANAVTADADGNVIVVGRTWGWVSTGLVGGAFVYKFDSEGNLLWNHHFDTTEWGKTDFVSVDAAQNIVVAGFTAEANSVAFVRKYDSQGVLLSHQLFAADRLDFPQALLVDADDNLIITGHTFATLSPEHPSVGEADVFVVKFAPDGELLWTQQFGSAGFDSGWSVTVDAQQDVFVTGMISPGGFVAKFTPSGTPLWTHQFIADGSTAAVSACVNSEGSLLVAGSAQGSLLGQSPLGMYDAFVVKFAQPE